jgi:hypothetical protein
MSDDWFKTHKNVTPFDILSNLVIFLRGRVMSGGITACFFGDGGAARRESLPARERHARGR